MTPTDLPRTQRALVVVGATFLTQAGLSLVSRVAPFQAVEVLWLLVDLALVYAAFELKASVSNELTGVLFPVAVLNALFGAMWLYGSLSEGGLRQVPHAVSMVGMVVSLGTTLAFLAVVAKLGDSVPFAAGLAVFTVLRTIVTLSMPQLMAALGPSTLVTVIRVLLSLVIAVGIGVLALQARSKLEVATPGVLGGPLAAPAVVAEAGAGRLIATGAVLLLLGAGGSIASFAAASSGSGGGRYIVATGLIASGLVQFVRGLGKLGKAP